ncbi:MAG: membrane protein insertase YidC [Xanthomonadales bacterium]|nr:membrane protein insertase YidC [Xanthomonadales bacterium]
MRTRVLRGWLLAFGLLFSASATADVTVDSESLHLQFSERGDLLLVEACFPQCSKAGTKALLLSATQGMLVFDQGISGEWLLARETNQATTELVFTNSSDNTVRRWVIPHKGWMVSFSTSESGIAHLTSGMAFRPPPSSGFGNLLEQTRYLFFDGSSVESMSLDESEQMSRVSKDWFGFRNRFWTAMVLPGAPLSIAPLSGESVEDASITISTEDQGFDLDLYLGPIEPAALSQSASELESLMYSGLWFWLRWICQALYYLLTGIAMVVPQWGLAVMVLSVAVGVLMRPLSKIADRLQDQVHETDGRLAPTLAAIKKDYKGEQQSEKIIAMYKEANVHPLYSLKSLVGVFVVIPVFIGAFDMLAENIHLSGESFLWIADLSQPDAFMQLPFSLPFFGGYLNLLPFIMTGFSFIASKLHSHPAMDAVHQRKHSRNLVLMSLGFLVLFYTFPAGMVLYWTTNNLISVIKALWKRYKVSRV